MSTDIRLTSPDGVDWYVHYQGIERGVFSQVEAIREVAAIMSYGPQEQAPALGISPYAKAGGSPARQAPRDMYDAGVSDLLDQQYRRTLATLPTMDGHPFVAITGNEVTDSTGRPVDTFGRSPEEAAFIAGVRDYRRGIRYAGSDDWYGRGYAYAARQVELAERRRQDEGWHRRADGTSRPGIDGW